MLIVAILSSTLSFATASLIFTGKGYFNGGMPFDPKVVGSNSIKKFSAVKKILKNDYYLDVNEIDMLEGAIAGMTDALGDPYTVYFTSEQMKLFTEKSQGSYVGIGVSVVSDDNGILTVVEPFDDSPAKEAGIIKGDKIIKVDDTDVTDIRDENMIIAMIKGKENTKVKLTTYSHSEGKYIDIELIRKRIKMINIKSELLEGNIGYIKLIMFDSDIAQYFEEHLNNLLAQNIKGLIIDVRDNPGGAYNQVVKIADRLLPEGLIVYTEDKHKRRVEVKSDKKELELPLCVLINENSASASEILAGAVKDHEKGTLIGTKTFGKGLVQAVVPLNDGSGLKLTISRYFTPSGVCIQGIGIEPHEKVEVPEQYKNKPVSNIPRGDDVQLQTAIQVLRGKIQ
jgi:carboxyl-terminal processing protease